MDWMSLAWNVGILVAIGGVCAVVVGVAVGSANGGSAATFVLFNAGVFTLVLSLGLAASAARVNLQRVAMAAGVVGAVAGMATGFWAVFPPLLSIVALAGAAVAMRHPRASVVLMLTPAVVGWLAAPSLYSIPARVLVGACLLLAVHLAWTRFARDRPGTVALRELESRELSE